MSENIDSAGIIRPASDGPITPTGPIRPPSRGTPPPLPIKGSPGSAQPSVVADTPGTSLTDQNLTVGWLVIVAGPGRGRSLTLSVGMNHLGRATTNRLALDFGDEGISRKTHTTVTFDPRGRKFYVQPGPDAVDLTYLGPEGSAQPVLMPVEITGGEIILMGKTQLRFVPFCGSTFSWE